MRKRGSRRGSHTPGHVTCQQHKHREDSQPYSWTRHLPTTQTQGGLTAILLDTSPANNTNTGRTHSHTPGHVTCQQHKHREDSQPYSWTRHLPTTQTQGGLTAILLDTSPANNTNTGRTHSHTPGHVTCQQHKHREDSQPYSWTRHLPTTQTQGGLTAILLDTSPANNTNTGRTHSHTPGHVTCQQHKHREDSQPYSWTRHLPTTQTQGGLTAILLDTSPANNTNTGRTHSHTPGHVTCQQHKHREDSQPYSWTRHLPTTQTQGGLTAILLDTSPANNTNTGRTHSHTPGHVTCQQHKHREDSQPYSWTRHLPTTQTQEGLTAILLDTSPANNTNTGRTHSHTPGHVTCQQHKHREDSQPYSWTRHLPTTQTQGGLTAILLDTSPANNTNTGRTHSHTPGHVTCQQHKHREDSQPYSRTRHLPTTQTQGGLTAILPDTSPANNTNTGRTHSHTPGHVTCQQHKHREDSQPYSWTRHLPTTQTQGGLTAILLDTSPANNTNTGRTHSHTPGHVTCQQHKHREDSQPYSWTRHLPTTQTQGGLTAILLDTSPANNTNTGRTHSHTPGHVTCQQHKHREDSQPYSWTRHLPTTQTQGGLTAILLDTSPANNTNTGRTHSHTPRHRADTSPANNTLNTNG